MTTDRFSRRAALIAGLSGLVLPGVAWPQQADREVEGGIGGTGIVGVLTDFGSLIVGGTRVTTGTATRFGDAFGPLEDTDIRIGDSLTIEARQSEGNLVARRVHITHPLVGTIAAVSADGRGVTVNGVEVLLPGGPDGFGSGDRVAVSGLWRGAQVVGSRLSPARSGLDLVAGDVVRSPWRIGIGPVAVRGTGMTGLPAGSFAAAVGRYDPAQDRLRVSRFDQRRFLGAAGPLARLLIEGYLDPVAGAPGYRIAGLGHSFERRLNLQRFAAHRVLFDGAYTGRFAADSAVILPEAVETRRRLMRNLSAATRP